MNYYDVVLLDSSKEYDIYYTYKYKDSINIGSRVLVPFGKANNFREAVVVKKTQNNCDYEIKKVYKILKGSIRKKHVDLIEKLSNYYVANMSSILNLYFQKFKREKLSKNIGEKKYYKFNMSFDECLVYVSKLNNNLTQIPKFINENFVENSVFFKPKINIINTKNFNKLIEDNVISKVDKLVNYKLKKISKLNDLQNKIYNNILNNKNNLNLLLGVNASGKTEIFIHLLNEIKGVKVILVPELFQIPQLKERIKDIFGARVEIITSKTSVKKRILIEDKIKKEDVDILIGTYPALFLDVEYSLIIVDEAHDDSYRIKYPSIDVRKAVVYLSEIMNSKVIFSTATPSLNNYYDESFTKHYLCQTFYDNIKSDIKIIDMRTELINGNNSQISKELDKSIRECVKKNKQVLILMNKKGKNTYVSCRECGYTYKCEKCNVACLNMGNNIIKCKTCSYTLKVDNKCPMCKSKYIKYYGSGIIQVEQNLQKLYPEYKILRIESTMFTNENKLNEIYNDIKSNKYDIIIGTHIVSKALDIDSIGLSVSIMADALLNISEYSAYEKGYSILSQLIGRSSRRESGVSVIQTYNPDIYVFKHLVNNDYIGFADEELSVRMELEYPPFVNHILFKAYLEDENINVLNQIIQDIKKYDCKVSDIYQPIYSRVNNKNIYYILISSDENLDYIKEYFIKFLKRRVNYKYRVEVDPLYLTY